VGWARPWYLYGMGWARPEFACDIMRGIMWDIVLD